MILPAIFGLLIIAIVLWEAFETVVLPRRVTRRFRLTVLFYRGSWIPWKTIAQGFKKTSKRETFLSFYGPLSLLILFMFWAAAIVAGFGLLYYSAAAAGGIPETFDTCLYLSGTTMFTLGLGDVIPHTTPQRILAVTECGLGFGFLALVLSYLPVIYQAFSRREVNIVLLDARAGSPPTATEMLRRHREVQATESLNKLLSDWEHSAADILESHVSYPVVCYFRSQHNNQSWLSALCAVLDASALLITTVETQCAWQARLTFAICRHTVVDIAQLFNAAPLTGDGNRLPLEDCERMHSVLTQAGFKLTKNADAGQKLAELRQMYEPYLRALSNYFSMELPPLILSKEITDNWRTTAWSRISGFAASARSDPDDHAD